MKLFWKNSRKKGSAILIVMLLITVLATVALTVGYLAMAEVSMETSSEDGSIAYHAAEAGIEDGLLRFRYDRNVETPLDSSEKYDESKVERIEFGSTLVADTRTTVDKTTLPTDPNKQYYDLNIWYQDDVVGDYPTSGNLSSINTDKNPELVIDRDQTLQIDGDKLSQINLNFKFLMDNNANGRLELKVFDENGGITNESRVLSQADCLNIGPSTGVSFTVPVKGYAKIKPWGNPVKYVMKEDSGVRVDSGYTYIESTGYYGSAKRKLQAKIDRKTGKLLEIFDFVLGSNTEIK